MGASSKILYPVAVRALMKGLLPRLEAILGKPLDSAIDLNPAIADRIAAGERYDVGLTNPHFVPALIAANRADPATHRPFGRVPLAIGRKEGRGGGPVSTLEEIAALIAEADSIGYTGAGTSGHTFLQVMERIGLSQSALPKSRPMEEGEPVASVISGEIAYCVVPLSTILSARGVSPAAIFPGDLGASIDISAFLSPAAGADAVTILDFLTSPGIDLDLAEQGFVRFEFD